MRRAVSYVALSMSHQVTFNSFTLPSPSSLRQPYPFSPCRLRSNVPHNNPQDPDVYGEEQKAAEEHTGGESAEAEELEVVGGVEPDGLFGG